MSETVEETASNEINSPERERTRSPRDPPPPQQEALVDAAAAEQARRTCPVCLRVFDSAKAMWGHSWVHRERRDQIYAMNPPAPPPPPPPPVMGGGVAVAVGGGGGDGGGGSGWHVWRIDSLELKDRSCPRCSKVFNSPKAMYGHLHVHHERASTSKRGKGEAGPSQAVPPEEADVTATRAAVVVQEDNGDEDSPLSIDLNRPIPEEEEDEEQTSPLFDLNLTPPSS